jgi:hypothetical protein
VAHDPGHQEWGVAVRSKILTATAGESLRTLAGIENFEDRWNGEEDGIDRQVVVYLCGRYPA